MLASDGAEIGQFLNCPTRTFALGGINGFPTGRGDYTAVASDTLNWVHGRHSLKFGGEYRRINNNFGYSPGRLYRCSYRQNDSFIIDPEQTGSMRALTYL